MEDDMSGANTSGATTGENGGAVRVSVDVSKAEGDAVQKAMEQVTQLVDSIAKAAGIPADAPKTETPAAPVEKSAREKVEETFKSAGMSGDALTRAMSAYDAGQSAPDAEVEKAKTFTAERIAKLQDAIAQLQKLMMDVIPTGESPKSTVPQVERHGNPNTTRAALSSGDASVTKAIEEAMAGITKKVEELATTFKGNAAVIEQLSAISKRLETIEKARPASQSAGDDQPQTKTQKSLWSGLL
jgi:DNA-binding transcriptional MerR regulator